MKITFVIAVLIQLIMTGKNLESLVKSYKLFKNKPAVKEIVMFRICTSLTLTAIMTMQLYFGFFNK